MRKLVYYIGTTIDGYIAGPAGEIDFFFPVADEVIAFIHAEYGETIPTHIRSRSGFDPPNRRFDTVVMGRATYQPALDVGVTSPYAHLRQYVVSASLEDDAAPGVEMVRGDPLSLVRRLKEESEGLDVWLAGGSRLASAVLPEIDELVIKRYPILVGRGIPLFAADFQPLPFHLTDTRTFGDGTVVSTYLRRRP